MLNIAKCHLFRVWFTFSKLQSICSQWWKLNLQIRLLCEIIQFKIKRIITFIPDAKRNRGEGMRYFLMG